jgi:hypothetical protein
LFNPVFNPAILFERSRSFTLRSISREKNPNHNRLNLIRVPNNAGDYPRLCPRHREKFPPTISGKIRAARGTAAGILPSETDRPESGRHLSRCDESSNESCGNLRGPISRCNRPPDPLANVR